MERRQPIGAGAGIALVGYASSFAIVLAGLRAVGATPAQATSGLVVLCIATGLATLVLSRRHRIPLTIAWSTPGAAVLVGTGAVGGGWPDAVGAFALVGALLVLAGLWPRLGSLIGAIPPSIAQAMLAGVVLQICLIGVRGAAAHPWEVASILLAWLALARVRPGWAVPGAFAVALAVAGVLAVRHGGAHGPLLPQLSATVPHLSWAAVVSIALPLFIVTMAGQNVPGVAIMSSFGFTVPWRSAITTTGLGTLIGAPFGGHAINLAAITASVPASPLAHPDPRRRWPASAAFGATFLALAVVTTALTTLLGAAPAGILAAVAALGLLPTLGSSLGTALADSAQRTPAAVTLVVAASGVTIAGVGAATWALVAGLVVRAALTAGRPRALS